MDGLPTEHQDDYEVPALTEGELQGLIRTAELGLSGDERPPSGDVAADCRSALAKLQPILTAIYKLDEED